MKITDGVVATNIAWRFAERFLAQGISFIVSLVLARILVPDDYAAVSIITVILTFFDGITTRGFSQALVQKDQVDQLDYSSLFYTNILITGVMYAALYVASPWLAAFYEMPILKDITRVLGIRILISAYNSIQQAYIQRNMMFRKFFWSTLVGTLLSGIVAVWAAMRGAGAWALVISSLGNAAIDTTVLFFTIPLRPTLAYSLRRVKRFFGFGMRMTLTSLLESAYNEIRTLLIGKLYSPSDLAFYNKGNQIPALVVSNVQVAISGVLFSAFSRQQDRENVKYQMRRALSMMMYVLLPMLLGMMLVARPMTIILYTETWLGSVPYIVVYCLSYCNWIFQIAPLQALNSMGLARLTLRLSTVHRVTGLILLLAVVLRGPLMVAVSALLADTLASVLVLWVTNRCICYHLHEFWEDISMNLLAAVVMCVPVWLVGRVPFAALPLFCLQVVVGAGTYLVTSYLSRNKNFLMLWNSALKYWNNKRKKT